MENEVLITLVKTVFRYQRPFLRNSEIKFFSTRGCLFAYLEKREIFQIKIWTHQAIQNYEHGDLNAKNSEKKNIYTQLQGQIVKKIGKFAPHFQTFNTIFWPQNFPTKPDWLEYASKSSLMSLLSKNVTIY